MHIMVRNDIGKQDRVVTARTTPQTGKYLDAC